MTGARAMTSLASDCFPRSTPRHRVEEVLACPLAEGRPTGGNYCLRFCPESEMQACGWFSCKLLDEVNSHAKTA